MDCVNALGQSKKSTSMEGGRYNKRSGTDHVISGPMRGLEKTAPNVADIQTHTNLATL